MLLVYEKNTTMVVILGWLEIWWVYIGVDWSLEWLKYEGLNDWFWRVKTLNFYQQKLHFSIVKNND